MSGEIEERLKEHNITLKSDLITLRPMTEDDWDLLYKWDNDPDFSYYDGDHEPYDMKTVQMIYRGVSKNAYTFIVEYQDNPIGYCWLQKMNLDRIIPKFPGKDLRRIDLGIGEKEFWGKGLGTEMIRLLTEFGFEHEHADAIFGCSVMDYNPGSRRAFEKNGFRIYQDAVERGGGKSYLVYDLMITREEYESKKQRG